MWSLAADIPDAYVVVVLGAVLPALLLALGWAFNRLGSHDKDLAVLKERVSNLQEDITDLKNPGQGTRTQRRER